MSGDLEDFLRRAAQRRQAKAAETEAAPKPTPTPKPRPQYTNSRSERIPQIVEEAEEILTAQFVDDDGSSIAARMKRLSDAKSVAAAAEAEAGVAMRKARGMLTRQQVERVAFTDNTIQGLIATLQSPGGVQQMVLLKEILDRPTHRW